MATTVAGAFSDFKARLEITDRQTTIVSNCRNNVVETLKKGGVSLMSTPESLLIGSYDRQTLTRYLTEGDVDVMVVLDGGVHKDWNDAEGTVKALDKVKAVLAAKYTTTTMRRDRNCVTMKLAEFRLDVVPAFQYGTPVSYYTIPDSIRKQWVKTNPITFATKMADLNKTMAGSFIPVTKMVKGWNRQQGWPIRSFHLECLLHSYFSVHTLSSSYSVMLTNFFAQLGTALNLPMYEPVLYDRVDTYMDEGVPTRRTKAVTKATDAAASSAKALANDAYPSIAIPLWKGLLGEFFPTYG